MKHLRYFTIKHIILRQHSTYQLTFCSVICQSIAGKLQGKKTKLNGKAVTSGKIFLDI